MKNGLLNVKPFSKAGYIVLQILFPESYVLSFEEYWESLKEKELE